MTLGSNALSLKIPVIDLFVITLLLQEKINLLKRLIATDTDISKATDKLIREGQIIAVDGKLLLNSANPKIVKITDIKFRRDRYAGKKIFDYCSGLYGKFNDKLYPVFPPKAMPIVKDFLDQFPGTEAELLEAIQFYYEDLVEKEVYKGRTILLYTKSIGKLLADTEFINSLLAKDVVYSQYSEI